MNTVRTIILLVVIALVAIPAVPFVIIWTEAAEAIAKAERDGVLRERPVDTTLTVAERTIAIAEFEKSWNAQEFPCRPIATLWSAATKPDFRLSDSTVSGALSTAILMDIEWESQLRRHLVSMIAACQLEQRYSDTQMLRAWLANANFGTRPRGIESAARSLFGKHVKDLDPKESAQLAARLSAPHFRNNPERWSERARSIEEQVRASRLP